jgi:hypothetical protein
MEETGFLRINLVDEEDQNIAVIVLRRYLYRVHKSATSCR